MESVFFQVFINNEWNSFAELSFPEDDYDRCKLSYDFDYSIENFEMADNHAISINYPPVPYSYSFGKQPHFLDDIIPSGASRRYWVEHLDISKLPFNVQNYILLKYATVSPIGNLRVRNSIEVIESYNNNNILFDMNDVKERASDFLSYASERGGVSGGATGAGGEAPKLLIRAGKDKKVWIDSFQDGMFRPSDTHYLVKFPRGKRSDIDKDILIAEYYFYQEISNMGFSTMDVNNMLLEFSSDGSPSLWLPRFDIFNYNGGVGRFSMESVYSILGKGSGSFLNHEDSIFSIIDKIKEINSSKTNKIVFDQCDFVIQWVLRDLLNIAFGNTDNHGRNTSFLSFNSEVKLSPIYDFAPMKADPESIIRVSKWSGDCESGGEFDFIKIAEKLSPVIDSKILISAIKQTGIKLVGLKDRLHKRGVPQSILDFPSIGYSSLENKLKRWGVL